MLYIYDSRRGERSFMNVSHYKTEEGQKAIAHLVHFAKENGLWEPKKVQKFGWNALHIARERKLSLMYQATPYADSPRGEINLFAGTTILSLLEKINDGKIDSPEREELLSRVYVEVDADDKVNAMYLRQVLEYLDDYGHDPDKRRVVAFSPSDRDPYRMSILFEDRQDDGSWKSWMNGGMEFFAENAGTYKRDKEHVGWSVCT